MLLVEILAKSEIVEYYRWSLAEPGLHTLSSAVVRQPVRQTVFCSAHRPSLPGCWYAGHKTYKPGEICGIF